MIALLEMVKSGRQGLGKVVGHGGGGALGVVACPGPLFLLFLLPVYNEESSAFPLL